MTAESKQQALNLLRRATADSHVDFRDGQWEAIEALSEQQARLLVVQRTGWGKSLVYFLTTKLLRDRGAGPTLLISPLLSLMRNQLLAAERLGIRAATINSSNREEWEAVQARLRPGQVDVLLISPERLANDEFRENVLLPMAQRIGFFVVDEAHCISDWGHDFRPDYRRIARVLQALPPTIPILATTATANNRVVTDVQGVLGAGVQVVRGPLARHSLALQNINLPGQAARLAWLAEHLPRLPGSGIIYTLTVRDAQRVAAWLSGQGINAHAYFGDLDSAAREDLETRLLNNKIKALVATTALAMGFDKPDLGFVIHYQRPGSIVHYYQQVGRAGRAIEQAYGILLSGHEDQEITDYFIRSAFPPEAHVAEVLDALTRAADGLTLGGLQQQLNLSKSQIEKVLKTLSVQSPAPVGKQASRWYANPVRYVPDTEKVALLTRLRREEQARMLEYVGSKECLMVFLARELDDPHGAPCGRCAVCRGGALFPPAVSEGLTVQAVQFLRRSDQPIQPRRQWPAEAVMDHGWRGRIPRPLQAEVGRALCLWGDDGWGQAVRRGKQVDDHFDNALVATLVDMVGERWRPTPPPSWVTYVPSLNRPRLVSDLAQRVAGALGLPFQAVVVKTRPTAPQKEMQNSFQQAHNLKGAFEVTSWSGMAGPVLLVDDMVDSGWTFTMIAALLRQAGSGPVHPLALALLTTKGDDA